MKKRLAVLLSALFLGIFCAGALSGCHGKQSLPAFKIPETPDASKNYEITFWAKNDTNVTQTRIYKQAIEDFQKLYPNVTVNMRLYTDYSRIYNDVITNIATRTTPNVCITYPDHIATYKTGVNVVVPLDELMDDPKYGLGGSELRFDAPKKEELVPEFLDECILDGAYYALPFMRSTEALYINEDMVKALGYEIPEVVTWQFVFEVSEKAMAQDADGNYLINGQKVMIPFIYKSTDNMMIQYARQKDIPYSDEKGNIALFNEETKDFLKEISAITKSGAFSTFKISSYPGNFLNAGQCIFAVDSTAGATWMGTHAPLIDIPEEQLVEFKTVVRPVPQADPAHPAMISQGPSICIFNKEDPDEVLYSWLFVQYLLSNETQIAYAETEGYSPVTEKARKDPSYVDYLSREGEDNDLYYDVKLQATKLLIDNTENTFTTPVFNGSASLRTAAGALIEETAKATRRNAVIDDAFFEKLYQDTFTLYHLENAGSGSPDTESKDLGPLPGGAAALIITLAVIWVLLGAAFVFAALRKKQAEKDANKT